MTQSKSTQESTAIANPFEIAKAQSHQALTNDNAKMFYGDRIVESTGTTGSWLSQGLKFIGSQAANGSVSLLKAMGQRAAKDCKTTGTFAAYKAGKAIRSIKNADGDLVAVNVITRLQDLKSWFDIEELEPLLPAESNSNSTDLLHSSLTLTETKDSTNYSVIHDYNSTGLIQSLESNNPTDPNNINDQISTTDDDGSNEVDEVGGIGDIHMVLAMLDIATAAQLSKAPWTDLAARNNLTNYSTLSTKQKREALKATLSPVSV